MNTPATPITNERLAALMVEMLAEIRKQHAETLKPEHLQAVWTDERTWDAALTAVSKRLTQRTDTAVGGWFRSTIQSIASKITVFFILGMLVYVVGGWAAVGTLFKTVVGHGGHS
jgi:hypothetical protein